MLKKDTTKIQQKKLIDEYLKDEINILEFIKEHNDNYIDFEYPLSLNKKIMKKIKKDIKNYKNDDIQLTLKITNVEKSKYDKYEYEEFKITIIENFENEKEYKLSFYKHLLEKEKMNWHGNTYYLLVNPEKPRYFNTEMNRV